MPPQITAVHERVDDIPVIIALLCKLRVAELIDKHFPTNGNRTGLSLGQMVMIWLTFILSQADHRLNQVESWVAEHQITLSQCLGCEVQPRDCTDDRLATGLDYLNVSQYWQAFEAELNSSLIRTYDLKTERVRLDTTTASATVSPAGLFQFGHSKDHRPDLPQLKISMSVLDPLGLPLSTTVVAGNAADDPLYLPEIAKVRASLGRSGLLHIGDCKLAALENRADIVAHQDFYLCPLSALQMPTAELDRLLEPVFAGQQPLLDVYLPDPDEVTLTEPDLDERIAVGFEISVRISGKDRAGKMRTWNERRLVVRSVRFASAQTHALHQRLARAQKEIAALNQRKQGKPRLTSQAQAQAAAQASAEAQQVAELLELEIECQVEERTKRAYGARPATTVREESFFVRTTVKQQRLEQTVRRLGWRVYATNQPGRELPLEKAVWAYREQYQIEQGFGRLKGCPLSLTPFYLQYEHRVVGLILLLTVALRVLVLAQFVAREKLKEREEKLSGIYAGQPGRQTASPTTEMMLRAFREVTLSRITIGGEVHWHLTPLSDTQKHILNLLGLPKSIFSKLLPAIPKTEFHSREP
jgi:transposase